MKPITIVQGGQWGSEAKGLVAAYLTKAQKVDIAVRTGATNAGHTVVSGPFSFKAQQLPVGFVRPETTLVIGAGALIDPVILEREVTYLESAGFKIRDRLKIDRRAGLHLSQHAERSKMSNRHHTIGATGKGCSEALIDRIRNRGKAGYGLFGDASLEHQYDVCDTEAYLNYSLNEGAKVLLEGTQGQLLDLYLGPYPYTTHKQTGPAQWMLECGLSPALPTEICMVVRTFPIRVAGNSGPMPDETSWPDLARWINEARAAKGLSWLVSETAIQTFEEALRLAAKSFVLPPGRTPYDQHDWSSDERAAYKEALSEINTIAWKMLKPATQSDLLNLFEMTTVTKKLRRIAHLNREQLEVATRQVRPHWIALTFMNYLFPEYWYQLPGEMTPDLMSYIAWIGEVCSAPVRMVSFGPEDAHTVYHGSSIATTY